MLHSTQRGFEKVCFQAGIVGQKRKKTKNKNKSEQKSSMACPLQKENPLNIYCTCTHYFS